MNKPNTCFKGIHPFVFALLAVALGLPYVIVGPFAGVWVDRLPIRQVLIASNLGRALVTITFAFAPGWQVLLVLVVLRSSVDCFFTPAKQAAIQALTTRENRQSANGLSHTINQASKIVAPALGGGLLALLEPSQIFYLNAAISCVAALILARLSPLPAASGPRPGEQRMLSAITAGLTEISAKPLLRAALTLMAGGFFAIFFYDTLIAPLIREIGFDQTVLGLALAAVGAGGVIGAGLMTLRAFARPFLLVAIGSGLSALAISAFGLAEILTIPPQFGPFLAGWFAIGISSALSVVPIRTVIQDETAPERIARVTALSEAANTLALLSSPFAGAAIASLFSVGAAFVTGGLMLALLAVAAIYYSSLHASLSIGDKHT